MPGMKCRRRILFLLAGACLVLGITAGAVDASRSRDLERAFDRYDAADAVRSAVEKAFDIALKAGVDRREAVSLVEAALEGGFSPQAVARLLSLAGQLQVGGLPVESFVSKVEEGVAKRVPTEKIMRAAEERALTLKKADTILNGLVLKGLLEARDREKLLPDLVTALESGRNERDAAGLLNSLLESGESINTIRRKLLR